MSADQQPTCVTLLTIVSGILFLGLVLVLDLSRRTRRAASSGFLGVLSGWTLLTVLGWLALCVLLAYGAKLGATLPENCRALW